MGWGGLFYLLVSFFLYLFFLFPCLFQDVKNKLPDKAHLGFSVSDGIGRLQVEILVLHFYWNYISVLLNWPLIPCRNCWQIIKNSDLEELRELGSGTFGTVYHGKWRGTDVAIKRINDRCFSGKPSEQERMVGVFLL